MEDLPLGRIAALVPEFTVEDLPLSRTLKMIYIQGGREISAIIVTDVYLCYKGPKSP